MTELNYHTLASKYPELFAKARMPGGLAVDDGWYNILDNLFSLFTASQRSLEFRVADCKEWYADAQTKQDTTAERLDELKLAIEVHELRLAGEIAKLPVLKQVKEKFGTLRVYCGELTDQQHAYVQSAENMSYRTCEDCGAPGLTRSGGWVKTLCDTHYNQWPGKQDFHNA